MDMLIEKTMGDATISLRAGRHWGGVQRQIKLAKAIPAEGTPDRQEVDAFLRQLRGLADTDLDALAARLPAVPLPTGYRHFRLFDAATGAEWNSNFVVEERRRLTLHDVLFGALNHPTLQLASWTGAEWLPDSIPGVLDIELSFTCEPRTRPFRLRL